MSWYNSENWYAPNYEAKENGAPPQEASGKTPKAVKSSKKARIITVFIIAGVLLAALLMILFFPGGSSGEDGTEAETLPEDWHDYFAYLHEDPKESMEFKLTAFKGKPNVDITLLGEGGSVLSLGEIYDKMLPSVVGVRSFYEKTVEHYGWGTGVILSEDGYIVTNAHVIADAVRAEIVMYDGSEYDTSLVAADAATDLAILKIEATGLTPAVFASAETLSVGDTTIAIGNPLSENFSYTMTTGIVSAPQREVMHNGYAMQLIQSDAAINSGNSGGPLLNDRGEVIGISNMKMVTFFSANVEGIAFAIPSEQVKALIDSTMGRNLPTGPSIGITVAAVGEEVADYYDIPNGLYIAKVNEKSDAAAQGMKPGDIITAVDGEAISENTALASARDAAGTGGTLHFDVWRDGRELRFDVRILDAEDMR